MDSDKRWYDVRFKITGTMRVEGYGKTDAEFRAIDYLSDIQYNPVGWDNRELVGEPRVYVSGVAFVPQGYRTEDLEEE